VLGTALSKLAQLIATEEGFYVEGSIPNRNRNPGDLRHSPHSFHDPAHPNAIGQIDTVADGWADLERQLREFADRGLTLAQMINIYSPASDGNDPIGEIAYLCRELGCSPNTLVKDALLITVKGVSMSTPDPLLVAVTPELRAVIMAVLAFNAAMGPDPLKWAINYPGAQLILTGTIMSQVPALGASFGGAGITALDKVWTDLLAKLPPAP
jgi:hypothetical protein